VSLALWYAAAGAVLFASGFFTLTTARHALRRIVALNVMSGGAFLMLVGLAHRPPARSPDPVAQALVLTGIVVAVSATALALALARAVARESEDAELPEDRG
jgi:multicomponent Na+:H+ antiporter subunit C